MLYFYIDIIVREVDSSYLLHATTILKVTVEDYCIEKNRDVDTVPSVHEKKDDGYILYDVLNSSQINLLGFIFRTYGNLFYKDNVCDISAYYIFSVCSHLYGVDNYREADEQGFSAAFVYDLQKLENLGCAKVCWHRCEQNLPTITHSIPRLKDSTYLWPSSPSIPYQEESNMENRETHAAQPETSAPEPNTFLSEGNLLSQLSIFTDHSRLPHSNRPGSENNQQLRP